MNLIQTVNITAKDDNGNILAAGDYVIYSTKSCERYIGIFKGIEKGMIMMAGAMQRPAGCLVRPATITAIFKVELVKLYQEPLTNADCVVVEEAKT